MLRLATYTCFLSAVPLAHAVGLLLLYRPKDVSSDCAYSYHLRYDVSFGMGMSDTITLVFRSLTEIDYACIVDIVTDDPRTYLLVVLRYPNGFGNNCDMNVDAFTVIMKNSCYRLCDLVTQQNSHSKYIIFPVLGSIQFKFMSNSSINAEMNAHFYQVTVTAARKQPRRGCNKRNETSCSVQNRDYCFTSGVVCDGIKNCGGNDWFDERMSQCGLPVEQLSYAPVIAVGAVLLCAVFAAGHVLLRCLPPLASSYFIFNANEDNRLCIDTVFRPPDGTAVVVENVRRSSLIPISSSSSDTKEETPDSKTKEIYIEHTKLDAHLDPIAAKKKSMSEKLQEQLRKVRGRSAVTTVDLDLQDIRTIYK